MTTHMTKREYIDAIQFDGSNFSEVISFGVGKQIDTFNLPKGWGVGNFSGKPQIEFPGGVLTAGMWLIRLVLFRYEAGDTSAKLCAMDDDRFVESYMPADAQMSTGGSE